MSQEIKKKNENEIRDERVRDAVAKAACNGSVEFITEIVQKNPELVWTRDLATRVFRNAIDRREAKVFSLIYGLHDREALANFVDSRTTILHKVGEIASSEVLKLIPGAALQMQREIQWFKVTYFCLFFIIEYKYSQLINKK